MQFFVLKKKVKKDEKQQNVRGWQGISKFGKFDHVYCTCAKV